MKNKLEEYENALIGIRLLVEDLSASLDIEVLEDFFGYLSVLDNKG